MTLFRVLNFIINHPLNRKSRLKSIVRFVKWQIGSRLVSSAVVYHWINGSKFLVKSGETGLTGNIYTGLHEFSDMGFLLHFLRKNDLFVDVGANAGSYTILACAVLQAKGIAFEPVPGTFERLVENIRLNHLDGDVTAINKGVGDKESFMQFTSGSDTTNHVLSKNENCVNPISVEITTLDNVLKDKSPLLIKIDVEGYESLVLKGAIEVLKNPNLKAVIMELNGSGIRYGYDEIQLIELMQRNGFESYSYDPFERGLINLEGKNIESGNNIFIRDKLFVEKRLKTSEKVLVHEQNF